MSISNAVMDTDYRTQENVAISQRQNQACTYATIQPVQPSGNYVIPRSTATSYPTPQIACAAPATTIASYESTQQTLSADIPQRVSESNIAEQLADGNSWTGDPYDPMGCSDHESEDSDEGYIHMLNQCSQYFANRTTEAPKELESTTRSTTNAQLDNLDAAPTPLPTLCAQIDQPINHNDAIRLLDNINKEQVSALTALAGRQPWNSVQHSRLTYRGKYVTLTEQQKNQVLMFKKIRHAKLITQAQAAGVITDQTGYSTPVNHIRALEGYLIDGLSVPLIAVDTTLPRLHCWSERQLQQDDGLMERTKKIEITDQNRNAAILQAAYKRDPYPSAAIIASLASQLKKRPSAVSSWFRKARKAESVLKGEDAVLGASERMKFQEAMEELHKLLGHSLRRQTRMPHSTLVLEAISVIKYLQNK